MSPPAIRCQTLNHGLTVLLHETHLAPVVEIQIWVDVGSADEREGQAGLAHFHEHMLFKGTTRRGVGEVAGEVEGAGGRINAFTSYDVTVYHATLPSDQLGLGIDVLADAVLHSCFDPEEIAREIDVVLEEIRRSEDSPGHVLGNLIHAESYRAHPYRAPILGTPQSVAGFDRDKVRGFFEQWYRPERMTVVIVGDFDPDEAQAWVEAAFADARPGRARRERRREPGQDALRSVVAVRPFERVSLEFAYAGLALRDADAPRLDLLAFILGYGDSSRLVRRVREAAGLADRIDASAWSPLDPGVASVDIETDPERAAEAIATSVAEIERLRRDPVPAAELEKARANFLASEHFERESVSGLGYKLGHFQVTAGDHRAEQRYLDTVRAATPEELQRVARSLLDPSRLTVAALLPEDAADALDAARVREAVERGVARTERAFRAPTARREHAEIARYALPGGATLYVEPRREVPVVAARAAFLGGVLTETAESSGLTAFLSSMWLRGTRNHSAADFARATESLAAEIDSFAGRNGFGATLETPSERLGPALALFADVLTEPALDREEVERERRETLAAIERREDRLGQRAFLLFAETLFREHPYRMSVLGSAASVAALDRDALLAHQERWVRAENLVLAVAGDVDPDGVAARLSSLLADLPEGGFEPAHPPIEAAPAEIRRAELRKDRAQAHLVIGFRGLRVDDEDRFALEVISQLLAGQGGRLFLELRDRRGLAYSVLATNVEGVAPGWFSVYIATAPEKLDAAREGLLEELVRLLESPPAEPELERARRYLIGNFAIDQQRNAVRAAYVALDARYGLGADASRRYAQQVAAVSKDDVIRVARRVIDLAAYTEAIVRP